MVLGFRNDADDAARKAVRDRAAALVAAVERAHKGKSVACDDPMLTDLRPVIVASLTARAPFDAVEAEAARSMKRLARQLPVAEWAAGVRGLGEMGLAQIVGEAGDLSGYAKPAKLWKRMGLAVLNGRRQGAPGDGAGKADWIAHGYNAARRSVMWNIGGCLLKTNGAYADLIRDRKAVERAKAEAAGLTVKPAGQIKASEKALCMSVGHVANRAQRYAEKRLLLDLWRAWRDAKGSEVPNQRMRPADDDAVGEARP